jgi:hypothetical protein
VALRLKQAPKIVQISAEFRTLRPRAVQQVLLITQIPHPNYLY